MNYRADSPRERVLEAMVRVAATDGYAAATVDSVAARAGVSREEFEAMFVSRDHCFLEAYEAVVDVLFASFQTAYEGAAGPWSARVTAGLRALLELLAAEAGIARMALVEIAAAGEDARYRYRLAINRFLPFAEAGRAAAANGEDLPEGTARFAVGGVVAMIFDEIRAGREAQLPATLPDLVFTLTMPFLGREGAREAMRAA